MEFSINTQRLWEYFTEQFGNKNAAAGLIAAFEAVSECSPYLNWALYKGYLSTDETCFMKDFAHDKKPFGIAGWKKWHRKQSLFNFAKKAEEPIYDLKTQIAFVMDEFSGTTYGPVLEKLKNCLSYDEAFSIVMTEYLDIPKKTAESLMKKYAALPKEVYEKYTAPAILTVPKQYVKTDLKNVRVIGGKRKRFPFFRKRLGYLVAGKLYPYIVVSEDPNEYAIEYEGKIGYVSTNKSYVVTRMEQMEFKRA